MSDSTLRDLELSDIFGLIISNHATTRARFKVIMQSLARIQAHLEDRDDAAILDELMQAFEEEKEAESQAIKSYFRQAPRDDDA